MQKQLLKVQVSKAAIFSCKATTINLENCKYIDIGTNINLSQNSNHKGTKIPQCIIRQWVTKWNTTTSYKTLKNNILVRSSIKGYSIYMAHKSYTLHKTLFASII